MSAMMRMPFHCIRAMILQLSVERLVQQGHQRRVRCCIVDLGDVQQFAVVSPRSDLRRESGCHAGLKQRQCQK
jgi:hypothetical protein